MQKFLRICVLCSCVVLLYTGGTVDVHAQVPHLGDIPFLEVIGATGFDPGATVGTELTAVFRAGYDGVGEPRMPLRITASPNINITLPTPGLGIHMTIAGGILVVRGTLLPPADTDFYIQAEWGHIRGDLIVQARPPREPGTLMIVSGDFQEGGLQTALGNPLVVLVRDRYGEVLSGVDVVFRVTRGDGSLSRPTAQTNSVGRAETILTLAAESGIHQVEASVAGFPSLTQAFTAAAAATCEVPPPPVPLPPPHPTSLNIVSGNNESGEAGKPLAQPFVVEVKNGDEPLGGVDVTFKITAGDGKLWGKYRQTIPTNEEGEAGITLTLGPEKGVNHVIASVFGTTLQKTFTATATDVPGKVPPRPTKLNIISGDNQSGEIGKPLAQPFVVEVKNGDEPLGGVDVTFRVTAGGGELWGEARQTISTNGKGKAGIILTLGSEKGVNRVIASVVGTTLQKTFIAAATVAEVPPPLPVVYWIEDGAIFQFDRRIKQALVEPSEGWTATSVAVDTLRNKLYWTERQDEWLGRIWSANLNGKNPKNLKSIKAVPKDIVVDARNGRLYFTNDGGGGKIQRINVDGKGFTNFIEDLGSPHHIALDLDGDAAWGNIYWTVENEDRSWSIWGVPLDGRIMRKEIVTGLGKLGGIAVDGDKLYWTEEVKGEHGKISSAYKTGSGVETLFSLPGSVPLGLAVDEVGRRLYWTDDGGNIQSLNLDAPIEIVLQGVLSNPAVAIVLGRSAVAASPTAPSTIVEHSVESALLANYPNPFNPETWIPYQLSASADVSVSIYAVDGRLVRRLELGHQGAGVYQSRSRAAYWDGRNAFGERVASGLYFYTLTAGDFTATRKMLIRK